MNNPRFRWNKDKPPFDWFPSGKEPNYKSLKIGDMIFYFWMAICIVFLVLSINRFAG